MPQKRKSRLKITLVKHCKPKALYSQAQDPPSPNTIPYQMGNKLVHINGYPAMPFSSKK